MHLFFIVLLNIMKEKDRLITLKFYSVIKIEELLDMKNATLLF